jgi:NAD(P)-dependent dehydrogenase (short-subunit alcohol dehydrogenase family)
VTTARDLDGRAAIVTGSSRGIGRGIALKLAERGAGIVVNGTTPELVDETVALIRAEGNAAVAQVGDVRSSTDWQTLVGRALSEFGRLDILVNNAGVNRDAWFFAMTEEQWDEVVDVNLKGVWLGCKHAAPIMRENRYGRIVNIGSEGGNFGNMGMVNYVSAKAGLFGLTMAIARELGRWVREDGPDEQSLTCNLIMPGFNETRITDGLPPSRRQQVIRDIVLGRPADAREDVGSVVAFLASPAGGYVTGSKIAANGGIFMSMVG